MIQGQTNPEAFKIWYRFRVQELHLKIVFGLEYRLIIFKVA